MAEDDFWRIKHMNWSDTGRAGMLRHTPQPDCQEEPPQQPWKRCPSTHCERRGECASPSDCMVRNVAPPMHYGLATDYTFDDMQVKLL